MARIIRITALAVLALTALQGGIIIEYSDGTSFVTASGYVWPDEPPVWPDERAYAVGFGDFFESEDRAPGEPLACRPLEGLSDRSSSGPAHANLYLIVSPREDGNVGCLVEPWDVPAAFLPSASPGEEIEIVVTPEQWIPSSETLARGGKSRPDLAISVNASAAGRADSEAIWVPLAATANDSTTFYTRLIEGQKQLVFRTPLGDPVELQIAGHRLENPRWQGLRRATEVLWGSLAGASGLLAPFQAVSGGTAGILAALRTVESRNRELDTAFDDLAKLKRREDNSLFRTSTVELQVAAGGRGGESKLAKGRWLVLKNGARFAEYGLRVKGLQGAGAPAVLEVARKADGTELTEAERAALGFDDYVIFAMDVRDVPTRREDRRRIESVRERSESARAEFADIYSRAADGNLEQGAVSDYIARYEGFAPAAELVSRARSALEAARAAQVAWAAENNLAPRNSKALLIGIGDYASAGDLPLADLDMRMMREVAGAFGIVDIRELRDEAATAGEMRNALRALAAGTGPDDLILVYFSGLADTDQNQLVAHDTLPSEEGPHLNAVGVGEFIDLLGGTGSGRVLAVLDSYAIEVEASSLPAGVAVLQADDVRVDNSMPMMTREGSVFTKALNAAVSAVQMQGLDEVSVGELFVASKALVARSTASWTTPTDTLAGPAPRQYRTYPSLISSWTTQQRLRLTPPWSRFLADTVRASK